jgi:hypothetical protein
MNKMRLHTATADQLGIIKYCHVVSILYAAAGIVAQTLACVCLSKKQASFFVLTTS